VPNGNLALLPEPELAPAPRSEPAPPEERRTWRTPWALLAVLALQAGISLSFIWSNSAFADEANYLWVGHLEWAHWLHGGRLPTEVLSGAPLLYPPIGALANDIGGLAGARILSLLFMLAATALLYSAASRLFGRRAAVASAALWAVSVSALKLGSFATFDPMAVFLMCLAAWLVVQATYRRHAPELAVLAVLALLLADLTAYSYALYDPAVVVLAFYVWLPRLGARRARELAMWLICSAATLAVLIPTAMGLWGGIIAVTITRSGNAGLENQGYLLVAQLSWGWSGLVAVLGVAGAVTAAALREDRRVTALLAALAASAFLVPLYQLHLQTGWSLDKHLACGIWFAAIPAGYLIARVAQAPEPRRGLIAAAGVAALAFPAISGWQSAYSDYQSWPNASRLIATVRPLVAAPHTALFPGNVTPWILDYYTSAEDHNGPLWGTGPQVSLEPTNLPEASWPGYYRQQVGADKYSVVILTFPAAATAFSMQPGSSVPPSNGQLRLDLKDLTIGDYWNAGLYDLAMALEADPHYELVRIGPYSSDLAPGTYMVWKRI